jgi:hypothetical protein
MTRLQETFYPPEKAEFLATCRQMGVVLDICGLGFDAAVDAYEISRQAALEAMRIYAGRLSTEYYRITLAPNVRPQGRRIGVAEFLGKGFDFQNERVDMFSYNNGSRSSLNSKGFLRALLDPPYSLRLPVETEAAPFSAEYGVRQQARMTVFLFEFLEKILGVRKLPDFSKYEIYSWSDDWSNYFDAGKEWWGCFYWTLLDPENKTVTVIGASTTD